MFSKIHPKFFNLGQVLSSQSTNCSYVQLTALNWKCFQEGGEITSVVFFCSRNIFYTVKRSDHPSLHRLEASIGGYGHNDAHSNQAEQKKHIFGCESCFVKRQKLRENNRPEKMDEKSILVLNFFYADMTAMNLNFLLPKSLLHDNVYINE